MSNQLTEPPMPAATAIGTFDGVHKGHLAVLGTLAALSDERGLNPIAITFDRHPLELISPQRAPKALSSIEKKGEMLREAGVTPVILPFDEELRATTARDWMRLLRDKYNVRLLVVGYDNTFGSDGVTLSIADYRKMGLDTGIDVVEAPIVQGISSSAIRKAVEHGDVEHAADMLGRHFSLHGTVVDGNKLGRTIGFPTANLLPEPGMVVPAHGVYAARAILPGSKKLPAMVNIGVRPTIRRGEQPTIEAHILNWEGDLYGHHLTLEFHKRLRDEQQFKSIEALRKQLEKDASDTKSVFN